MSKYRESPAQLKQNSMVGEIFFKGDNGQKLTVISPLNTDNGVMWFLTHDPETGLTYRNEIKIIEI